MTSPAEDCGPSPATVEWALRALGRRAATSLTPVRVGSTAVHVLGVEARGGGEARFVLRRFVDRGRLGTDPWHVPRHEVVALELLEPIAVPAPCLVAADVAEVECDACSTRSTCSPTRPPPTAPRKPGGCTSGSATWPVWSPS